MIRATEDGNASLENEKVLKTRMQRSHYLEFSSAIAL
jgi:hypothetical protein